MKTHLILLCVFTLSLVTAEPDPEVVAKVVSPISYGPVYTGIHNVAAKAIPGTVTYAAPSWYYYGRKKREADPGVVGSVVSPISYGALHAGITHKVTHTPGTVTYSAPKVISAPLVYYGRKKREADPGVVGSVVSPISYGALHAGITHKVTHTPGTVTYSAPKVISTPLVYYGRKKREADPGVVGSVVSPISYGALYTGIHNTEVTHTPGTVTYAAPKVVSAPLVYYGRKKREADPGVVASVVSPISYGALYTGIHKAEVTHTPGTVTYSAPSVVGYAAPYYYLG